MAEANEPDDFAELKNLAKGDNRPVVCHQSCLRERMR